MSTAIFKKRRTGEKVFYYLQFLDTSKCDVSEQRYFGASFDNTKDYWLLIMLGSIKDGRELFEHSGDLYLSWAGSISAEMVGEDEFNRLQDCLKEECSLAEKRFETIVLTQVEQINDWLNRKNDSLPSFDEKKIKALQKLRLLNKRLFSEDSVACCCHETECSNCYKKF